MTADPSPKLDIDWLKTIAGALAAVSSAVLLSTLGAAGTIIGAALGSVIATVGGALYSQGLAHSRERLAQAQTLAMRRVGIAQAEVRRASRQQGDDPAVDAHLAHADERLGEAKADLGAIADEPSDVGWRERLVVLPWKRISLVAAGLFAAAILAITAFELVAGESVSSITGGTDGGGGPTISRIGGGSDDVTRTTRRRPMTRRRRRSSRRASPRTRRHPRTSRPTRPPTRPPSRRPSPPPRCPRR